MSAIAIVFAGGSGSRMGAPVPKQFLHIEGRPVLVHTLEIFERHPRIEGIVLVIPPEFEERAKGICQRFCITKIQKLVPGGASAQESIYKGLVAAAELYSADSVVLLHDGVRPYVDSAVVDAVIDSVETYGSGVTYTPCFETVVLSKDGLNIDGIPTRNESFTVQAPQAFRLGEILSAHRKIQAMPERYDGLVDQATLCWKLGIPIHLVKGNRGNIKITTPEDLYTLRALIRCRSLGQTDWPR